MKTHSLRLVTSGQLPHGHEHRGGAVRTEWAFRPVHRDRAHPCTRNAGLDVLVRAWVPQVRGRL